MDQIAGFPMDGRRWWVRWVDHVELPSGGTASPGIHVLLSPLPDDTGESRFPRLAVEGKKKQAVPMICRVLAGAMPGLTIGTVFQDGIRIGRLEADLVPVTFTFERSRSFVWPACSNRRDLMPEGWPAGWSYWLLSMFSYPLGRFSGGNCLVLHDGEKSAIIPCFEVFRALYAPHQEIALALLKGPWDQTWPQVANPVHTRCLPDGEWQIGLRRRIRNAHAPVLANLVLSPTGRAAANGVYAALLGHAQGAQGSLMPAMLELAAARDSSGPTSWREDEPLVALRADLPFEWKRLALKLRAVRLPGRPPKYFGFEIAQISWPPPPFSPHLLWYYRDNSGTPAEEPTRSELPMPFVSDRKELTTEEDGIVPVTSEDDPKADPQSEVFQVVGPTLLNLPPMREVPKLESSVYEQGCSTLTNSGE